MDNRLNAEDGRTLLRLARSTIASKLGIEEFPSPPSDSLYKVELAAFVTLKIGSKLRGCVGNLVPVGSLFEGVRNNALNAAFHDSRFPALTEKEFADVHLHISILTKPQTLKYKDAGDLQEKLRPSVDGVILQDGRHRATFLPQVWEQLPSVEAFLGQLCLKAGLTKESWREGNFDIQIYQVQDFSEEEK